MDEDVIFVADAEADSESEAGTGAETSENQTVVQDIKITVDSAALAAEVAVLEGKLEETTAEVKVLSEKVSDLSAPLNGCYYMLIVLVVLSLRRVLLGIIRKTRGGIE